MTEHTPGPADAPWLVLALQDVAERRPVAPAPPLDPFGRTPARPDARSGGRRALAVAAAVLVLVAVVGVVAVALRGSDPDPQEAPALVEAGAPTGWYIPTDLPDGWSVRSVTNGGSTLVCPCVRRLWAGPDASWIGYSSDPASQAAAWEEPDGMPLGGGVVGNLRTTDVVEIDLGRGASGTIREGAPGVLQVSWIEGDRVRSIGSSGVDDDELMAVARNLVGQPDPSEPLVDGWEQTYALDAEGSTAERPLVLVEVETSAGASVRYLLMPSGDGPTFVAGSDPEDFPVGGQPLPMVRLGAAPGRDRLVDPLVGRWPGADVYVDLVSEDAPPSQDDLTILAASLRPATEQQWRQFLRRTGTTDPALTGAERLDDVAPGD